MHTEKKYPLAPDFLKQLNKRENSCWLEVKIESIDIFIFSSINSLVAIY